MRVGAIIVAAGHGVRAGGDTPKQFRPLAGRPVLGWSVRAFEAAGVSEIVVATEPDHGSYLRSLDVPNLRVVRGGATRTASVRAALAAIEQAEVILIHDAARPGLDPSIIDALLGELECGAIAVAPVLAVADTLVRVDDRGVVVAEIARGGAVRVQTPQAFDAAKLRHAYGATPDDIAFSDDLAVMRAAGFEARIIAGSPRLMKITYPGDHEMLEQMLSPQRMVAVGHGFDAHRFGEGDHVTLCGVIIPHNKGLRGHSDADAGWHALVDAILGALGEGDIGAHFPPSDPQWKGANSELFLRHARQLSERADARIAHVDVTLICERPKIGPHREAMRARTAGVLGLPLSRVSVKATTTEGMGFAGREEGLAAQATATLARIVT